VFKRWVKYRGTTRPEFAADCPEKIDREFIRFICSTYYPRKEKMVERFTLFKKIVSNRKVYILKSQKEMRIFLEGLTDVK